MKEFFIMEKACHNLRCQYRMKIPRVTLPNMVMKHYPLGDAKFGIRFLVNSNIYPVCQSLKNNLRVGAGQTVIAECVLNILFQMGMGGCCFSDDGIPESILLFWTVDIRVVSVSWSCVGLFFAFGFHCGAFGVRLCFWIFVSGLLWTTGHGGWGGWVFLLGAAAFGVWGLGLWLFLIISE